MLFLTKLQQHGRNQPDKIAIDYLLPDRTETVSYGQLEAHVQQTMGYLQALGPQSGDRVALQLPKCLPFVYLHLAIMRLGAITLPLNPGYPHSELNYFLADSGASLFFVEAAAEEKLGPLLAEISSLKQIIPLQTETPGFFLELIGQAQVGDLPQPPGDPDLTALMIYTSGTTGLPKGVLLSHSNIVSNVYQTSMASEYTFIAGDEFLLVAPMYHAAGIISAISN